MPESNLPLTPDDPGAEIEPVWKCSEPECGEEYQGPLEGECVICGAPLYEKPTHMSATMTVLAMARRERRMAGKSETSREGDAHEPKK